MADLRQSVKKHLFSIKNDSPDKDNTEDYRVLTSTPKSPNTEARIYQQKIMEASNGQNKEMQTDKKCDNAEAGESPSCWKSSTSEMHDQYRGVLVVS